jgi:Zn-dependent peptidase ImmA (M78 family)
MAKSMLRYEMARRLGEKKALEFGFTEFPVDPFAIADRLGILVSPKPTSEPGVSGFLMKMGDTFGIMYATNIDNDGRKRFTVAHELGHYFLPGHPEHLFGSGDGVHASKSGFITRDPHELEADYFATGLLMPSQLFARAADNAGEGFKAVEALAALCGTSLTATAIRFAECSEHPVAAVVSDGDRVAFCAMSDCIRSCKGIEWLSKGSIVAGSTATFKFNKDEANVAQGRRAEAWTTLDLWFDGAPELEMKEDVVGLGGYRKTLTMLFTNEPLEEDDEGGEDDD